MFSCKAVCEPVDPTTDTVKVNIQSQVEEQQRLEAEEQRRRQEEEEAQRLQQEERRLAEAQAMKERAEAEARRMEAEQARRAELARKQREADEARRAEEARRREAEEAQRAEQERLAAEQRKAAVAAFLKEYGFASVTAPRKKLMKTNYALHKAAKLGDAQLCEMLLQEGADPAQKDSRGKTPGQVAVAKNSKNSHAVVIQLLGGQTKPTVGGA